MFSARDLSERIPKLDAEGGSKDDDHDSVNQGQHKRRAADNDGKHGNPNEQVSDSFGHRFSVFRVPDYIELLPGSTGRVIHSEGNQTLVAFGTVLDEEVQTALLEMQSRARIPDYGKSRSSTTFQVQPSSQQVTSCIDIMKVSSFVSVLETGFLALPCRCFFPPLSDRFAAVVRQVRQMACRVRVWAPAFFRTGSCFQRLVWQATFDARKHVVHAVGHFHVAPIEPPSHFVEISMKVFRRDPVMDTEELALQKRPNTFDGVSVNRASNVFAARVIDRIMKIITVKAEKGAIFVSHDGIAGRDVFEHRALHRYGSNLVFGIWNVRNSPSRSTMPSTTSLLAPPCDPGVFLLACLFFSLPPINVVSLSMVPFSGALNDLVRAACRMRWRTCQAVFCVIFKSFAIVVLAIPFGWLLIIHIAMNHLRSGNLVS
jgi:hypothetical protein